MFLHSVQFTYILQIHLLFVSVVINIIWDH